MREFLFLAFALMSYQATADCVNAGYSEAQLHIYVCQSMEGWGGATYYQWNEVHSTTGSPADTEYAFWSTEKSVVGTCLFPGGVFKKYCAEASVDCREAIEGKKLVLYYPYSEANPNACR